jgi:hypothetical protein
MITKDKFLKRMKILADVLGYQKTLNPNALDQCFSSFWGPRTGKFSKLPFADR